MLITTIVTKCVSFSCVLVVKVSSAPDHDEAGPLPPLVPDPGLCDLPD